MQSKTPGTYVGAVAVLCLLSGTVMAEESAALFADGRGRSLGPFECAARRLVWSDEFDGTALDPADGFHVYAMEWDRQGVTCFYDGRPYGRYSFEKYGEAFAKPHYILLNLAMGAPWMMPEKDVVVEDATRFEIDWIRVYE